MRLNVTAVVLLKALGQVPLRHVEAARVIVPDIQHDQIAAVPDVFRHIMHNRRAAKPVHNPKPNCILIEDRGQNSTNGVLLARDYAADGLLEPEVAPV